MEGLAEYGYRLLLRRVVVYLYALKSDYMKVAIVPNGPAVENVPLQTASKVSFERKDSKWW
jgi:hypothetical protein